MRKLLTAATFLLLFAQMPAQTMLQDALALKSCFVWDEDSVLVFRPEMLSDSVAIILGRYMPENTSLERENLRSTFDGNPFIDMESAAQSEWAFTRESAVLTKAVGSSGAPAGNGAGFSVSNLADGLARFLVKRTKQELSMAFFNDFKEKIAKDPYLGNFCPLTKAQLELVDSDIYQFNDYLESLREAFTADMTALPGNLERYLLNDELCQGCAQKADGIILADMLHIAQQMVNGEPPLEMIAYLGNPDRGSAIQNLQPAEPNRTFSGMASGLRFLNMVSESLRNPATWKNGNSGSPWYTARQVREFFRDEAVLQVYLGLLWQRVADIELPGDSTHLNMRDIMTKAGAVRSVVKSWRQSIQSLSELTQSLQFSLRSNSATSNNVADEFFSYSQSLTDLLQSVNQIGRTMLGQQRDWIPAQYILLTRQCNALYFNVRQHHFAGAVGNVIYCLNLVNEDLLAKENKRDNKAMTDAEKAKAAARNKKSEATRKGIATLLKYANFMAAIAEANSPEEMEQAIETFALPPGSSRMKKQPGRFSVALNAYTGFAWGLEYLGNDTKAKRVSALTAPVGLSVGLGMGNAGSIGAFIPLIDVGAVTAYRFKDDQASNLPELTWANILSPGFYLTYDTPGKWPIAVGYGAQIGPGLRKVTEGTATVEKSGWRQGAFISVDIPITYFYLGKSRKQ